MKKLLSALLSLLLILSLVPVQVFAETAAMQSSGEIISDFAGGSGTADDPYLISNVTHLNNVRYYLSSCFKLINDITFTDADYSEGGIFYNEGKGWEPIDDFTGTFDGALFAIHNLKINQADRTGVGLFGNLTNSGAVIKNLILEEASILGGTRTGGIVGFGFKVSISYCHVNGNIVGNNNVGGIIGLGSGAFTIANSSATGTINGASYVGGICGSAESLDIRDNSIDSADYNTTTAIITNCKNSATVSGENSIGGIVGYVRTYIATSAHWHYYPSSNVYGYTTYSHYPKTTKLTNCYNNGLVEASIQQAGGIVGLFKLVHNSGYTYSDANKIKSKIFYCYNIGNVVAPDLLGGVIGDVISDAPTNSSYPTKNMGVEAANLYYKVGAVASSDSTYGEAKTAAQLQQGEKFLDLDFESIWTMEGDISYPYPELQSQTLRGTLNVSGSVVYDEEIVPDLVGVENVNETIAYQWYVDGAMVGNDKSYHVQAADVGKTLKLEIISTHPLCAGALCSQEVVVGKALQNDVPIIPEILTLDDKSVQISIVTTQEYSIDGLNWQADGLFENLDPNKTYTVYTRILENELYLLGESTKVLEITTGRRPISGAVSILGTTRYGDTLTADVSAILPKGATYQFEWKIDSTVVGTGETYTIGKDDIGKNIILQIKGVGDYVGTIMSSAITATKATVMLPNPPIVESQTNTSVLLLAVDGYEYSIDKVNWQASPLFEGLSAATEYTFYQRAMETDTTFASKTSAGTNATTLKNNVSAPAKPAVIDVTNTSVTLELLDGYEYSMDGITWQKSNVFAGLDPYTEYSFCQRTVEKQTDYASAQSAYTLVVTLKNSVLRPNSPTIQSADETSVTLVATSGYEYSMDGENWQDSSTFSNLTTLETYTFYCRVAETALDYASPASVGTQFKVKYLGKQPDTPVLVEKTNNKIVVESHESYQYSLNGEDWYNSPIFTGLEPNTTYQVYCRAIGDDTHYDSIASAALTVTTLKNTVNAPSAPSVSSKTDTTITLVTIPNGEYSKDGSTWQSSNVFRNLSPNKEYTFYQRYAETHESYVSTASEALRVYTKKSTPAKPSAPALSGKTSSSITVVKNSGYEYSIGGSVWQSSNVFEGLQPNKTYQVYRRTVETDVAFASEKSEALSVTTPKAAASVPPVPTVRIKTPTTITLEPKQGYEYSMDGSTWQTSNHFTGLTANREYTFYQRQAESSSTYGSDKSEALKVKTADKNTCSLKPVQPIVTNTTTNSIALLAKDGYEYSRDGKNWQSSNVFSGLSANTSYTFYQRIKESADEKASAASSACTAKTLSASSYSGVTTGTNYDKLRSFINTYGSTTSDGTKRILYVDDSGKWTYYYALENISSGILFTLLTDMNGGEKLVSTTEFVLKKTSSTIAVDFTMLYYYNYACIDAPNIVKSINRTSYTSNTTFSLSKTGNYINATQFSNTFSQTLQLLCSYFNLYIHQNLGFGLKGLGFAIYDEYGNAVCDEPSGLHVGKAETRNAYAATCVTNGYTGDKYCTACGGKITSGSTISCKGSHAYSSSCDDTCNTCGEMRRITHTYSTDCDSECNICSELRISLNNHVYDDKNDKTCNVCGSQRAQGDLDGKEGVTRNDAIYLLYNVIMGDAKYPLDQPCDFNGDGVKNRNDAIYLLYHVIMGASKYPLH